MKKLLFLILMLANISCAQAQVKIQDLTEDTNPQSTDVLYEIKNYATSPSPRKVKPTTVAQKLSGWTRTGTTLSPTTSTDNVSMSGTVTAGSFIGNGSGLTGISGGGGGGGSGTVSSGIASYFPYYATTGTTVSGQTVINFDGTNIGIGTATPGFLLDVNGIARFSGSGGITLNSGSALRTATTAGNTALLQAYNTGGAAYTTFATLTAGATPTLDLSSSTTIGTLDIVNRTGAQTLTNKTLTLPVIASISNSGTVTFPTGTVTLVARDTTDTLTNKTISSPKVTGGLLGLDGNTIVGIGTVASGVNSIAIVNGATGTDPGMTVSGDANRGFTATMAGTGGLTIVSTSVGPSTIKEGLTVNNDSNSNAGADTILKSTGNANTFHVVAATGNIGINSASPGAGLDIFSGSIRDVGLGTTVPQQLCRKSDGTFGYFNGAWASNCN